MNRIGKMDIVILGILIFLSVSFFAPKIPSGIYSYDEADYMYAVSKGFWANYLDRPSISFVEFVRLGFQRGLDQEERMNLSEFIRKTGDISFYRHYHGPLYYYYLAVMSHLVGQKEYVMRLCTFFWLVFCAILIYLGCFFLTDTNPRSAALVAATLVLFSPSLLSASLQLTPHSMFLFISLLSLLLMGKIIACGRDANPRGYLIALIICMTVALLTLENAPFLFVTLLGCVLRKRDIFLRNGEKKTVLSFCLWGLVLFLGALAVCWPGGLFKLTFLKNYLFHAHHAWARADYQGAVGALAIWETLWQNSPLDLALIPFASVMAVYFINKKGQAYLLPLVLFAALVILSNTFNRSILVSPKYISSSLPGIYLLTGIMLSFLITDKRPKLLVISSIFFVCLIFLYNYFCFYQKERVFPYDEEYCVTDNFIKYLQAQEIKHLTILLPIYTVPAVNYYFPQVEIFSYRHEADDHQIAKKFMELAAEGLLYAGTAGHQIFSLLPGKKSYTWQQLDGRCDGMALFFVSKALPPPHQKSDTRASP